MPTLSQHTAVLNFEPGNPDAVTVNPISCSVTVAENWSPSIRATVVIPSGVEPYTLDPSTPQFLGLRLQQDFGDLLYIRELTATYGGTVSVYTAAYSPVKPSNFTGEFTNPWNIFEPALPISTITTAYTPVTPLKLTNANLLSCWQMSDFLHTGGTFSPAESTVFDATDLMLRSVSKDYISGETTLELTSREAILLDSIGNAPNLGYTSLRAIINFVLDITGAGTALEDNGVDYTYSPALTASWDINNTTWEALNTLVTQANMVLYADEAGKWWLVNAGAVSGTLELKDNDNITALTETIDRNNPQFFDFAAVEYKYTGMPSLINYYGSFTGISKDRYFSHENVPIAGDEPQALVLRAQGRAKTWEVTAISNYDARPRQTMTLDLTGQPTVTQYIQSVTWNLPADTMNLTFR